MWWIGHFIGLGISMSQPPSSDVRDFGPALDLGIGYGLAKELGLGLHLRGTHLEAAQLSTGGACPTETYVDLYTADAGLSGLLAGDWGMAELWVGGHFATGSKRTTYVLFDPNPPPDVVEDLAPSPLLTFGALIAVDVWKPRPHRVSAYLSVQLSSEEGPERYPRAFTGSYTAGTLGIAYRHF